MGKAAVYSIIKDASGQVESEVQIIKELIKTGRNSDWIIFILSSMWMKNISETDNNDRSRWISNSQYFRRPL